MRCPINIDQADDAEAAGRQQDRHGVVGGVFDLDLHQAPEHEGHQHQIDDAAVDRDHLQDGGGIHLAAGDAGHHPAVVGHEPAGHHVDKVFFREDLSKGVLHGKDNDVHAVDGHGDEPDDPAEAPAHLQIKAAQHHQTHAEGAVEAGGDRLIILLHAGIEIHADLEDITDDEDGPLKPEEVLLFSLTVELELPPLFLSTLPPLTF